MDQIKIGKFIAAMRNEQKLTQRALAEELLISDKTVSKWETGKGLPEVSLMLPLCARLGISVNELLSGQRLDEASYKEKTEEIVMDLMKERQENKKKIVIEVIAAVIVILGGVTLFVASGMLEMPTAWRIVMVAVGMLVVAGGIAIACLIEREAGYFECRACGERFVPSMKEFIMAPHSLTTRYLKCPKCGKRTNCRKRLSKK